MFPTYPPSGTDALSWAMHREPSRLTTYRRLALLVLAWDYSAGYGTVNRAVKKLAEAAGIVQAQATLLIDREVQLGTAVLFHDRAGVPCYTLRLDA
jgi:hypothetical protein